MSATRSRTTRTTRRAVALALGALVAVLLPVTASAAKPVPAPVLGIATSIRFTDVYTPTQPLPTGAPGVVGLWYAVQDVAFAADLEFVDDAGAAAPLSTQKSTTVSVYYEGALLGSSVVEPGVTSTSVSLLAIPEAATDVRLAASADTKPKPVTGTSRTFDVLIESKPIETAGRTSIGGAGGTATECNATPEAPVCADLVPPVGGSFGENGLFSRGDCLATDKACLDSYVQALAAVVGGSPTNPATLVMKCDKELCGGGAIKSKRLTVSLTASDPGVIAPDCPAKGTVGAGQTFCVDYVQSTRDNAGDTILYLLFTEDAKVRFS